ncbi:MAG: PQQ-like beta-propeller repeat protein [Pirellulales bacterium]|nr:PQQ-like beta-propeller repeat protein [Pirellulales bacterium]
MTGAAPLRSSGDFDETYSPSLTHDWFSIAMLTKRLLLTGLALAAFSLQVSADEWPQWRGPTRNGIWRETGLLERFSAPQIPIAWQAEIGPGYSGPTVAGGRVFVTDRLAEPQQVERIHCFDAHTGKPIWTQSYDCKYEIHYTAGPRAAVTVDQGRAYNLGAMGHLHCYDAATGKLLWGRDLNSEYKIRMPVWGIAAAPLVFSDLVIVMIGGTDGACMVAFDKRSGDERWKALDDQASYSAPQILQQAGQPVLVCWTVGGLAGLNPTSGQIYWQLRFVDRDTSMNIAMPVRHKDRLFLTAFYGGCDMIDLPSDRLEASQLWTRIGQSEQNTDGLHSTMSTPLFASDYIYGVGSYGELRCLEAATGERVWEDLTAVPRARWGNIHFVTNGDRVWMFNERGDLIIARLTPAGYEEISRAHLIDPTDIQLRQRGGVCWSHPAFAYRHVFVRNDEKLVCASLAAEENGAE